MRKIVVGCRKSALAVTQTEQVISDLTLLSQEHGMDFTFELKNIVTKGDLILDVTLSKVGGKGLFVKEIEQAMLDKEIDMAVHCLKDMPFELPKGLINGAVPKREDPRDCLISRSGAGLKDLKYGARVGTSSLRRSSQLAALRPDLIIEPIRGNIDSRLRKLENGEFDAIILAVAGLNRMGWEDRITEILSPETFLPAVGQGALGIECREDDAELRKLLNLYNDPQTALEVTAERTFLGVLNGGCHVPIGAFAVLNQAPNREAEATEHALQEITLTGMVGKSDGSIILRETHTGELPVQVGEEVAKLLIGNGAEKILTETMSH
ncbi:hydroxymethylbilane synthase [Paenibacillus planticolens]|uniref:Porphobilinogen deaminase n=1 Tax=Paenibacillus planticolens TaxID=2654976 RepID=A0ABX1ZFJ4_9BACL|nr:hydroxymethylbilane synthase [Paenibacillus planticolens]NOU98645.1 hydroxymethylbilane synthase [Paenibacillus planticolens]